MRKTSVLDYSDYADVQINQDLHESSANQMVTDTIQMSIDTTPKRVGFTKDTSNVRIGDDDEVDSVQHLDISVIGDDVHLKRDQPGSRIIH